MLGRNKELKAWDQRPEEPNPSYIGFVLFLSLGQDRDRIIETDTGKQLWEILMSRLERMKDDTPLREVCQVMLMILKNMLREDVHKHLGKNKESNFSVGFQKELQKDRKLKSRIRVMISNLERVQRGEKL